MSAPREARAPRPGPPKTAHPGEVCALGLCLDPPFKHKGKCWPPPINSLTGEGWTPPRGWQPPCRNVWWRKNASEWLMRVKLHEVQRAAFRRELHRARVAFGGHDELASGPMPVQQSRSILPPLAGTATTFHGGPRRPLPQGPMPLTALRARGDAGNPVAASTDTIMGAPSAARTEGERPVRHPLSPVKAKAVQHPPHSANGYGGKEPAVHLPAPTKPTGRDEGDVEGPPPRTNAEGCNGRAMNDPLPQTNAEGSEERNDEREGSDDSDGDRRAPVRSEPTIVPVFEVTRAPTGNGTQKRERQPCLSARRCAALGKQRRSLVAAPRTAALSPLSRVACAQLRA